MNDAKKPLVPMGAITGKPGREELRANLETYRKAGIEQFLIYPRSGLEVEYMGPEWLEICRHIIEYCAEYGMDVWLYDEYNWPSGYCRGKVVRENSGFAAKKLVAFVERNFCGPEHSAASAREYFWSTVEIPIFADLLNPEAADCFLRLTHEVYFRQFKRYFGSTIKGIFSDEPSFLYALLQPIQGSALEVPYYEGMKEDYRNACGSELTADLEAYLRNRGREGLWSDIYALLGARFRSACLDRVRHWCDAHGILFTGHLLSEPLPKDAIGANGDPVAALRAFSMPGMDEIPSHSRFETIEWNTFKLLESAKNGPRTEALAELFALGPADMTPAKMREMIYLAALHGVTRFVTAVSALDARGNVEKPGYYNPVAPTQPWFPHIGILNDSAAIAAGLARKPSTAAIALRYPQREYCREWENPELKIDYSELVRALIGAQREFRLIGDGESAAPEFRAVLALTETGAVEERGGQTFSDIGEILDFLETNIVRRAQLLDVKGNPVPRILLKSYDDGTVCAVNTSGEFLRGVTLGGEPFDLPPRDVAVFPRPVSARPRSVLDLSAAPFAVRLEQPNSRRCIFDSNGEARIEAAAETHARLALRNYGGRVEAALDGTPVAAGEGGPDLPYGFRALYRETGSIRLSPGTHVLKLTNAAKDLPYLPSALCFGDFALGDDRVLRPLPGIPATADSFFAANLAEYAGTVVLSGVFNLSGCDGVAFEYRGMAVELIAAGQSLETRLWAPFEWTLPESLRRSGVELAVRISTSIGPLFGDYPDHLPESERKWVSEWWPGREAR